MVNGKRHREGDKPAITFSDGTKQYWVDDKLIRETKSKRAKRQEKRYRERATKNNYPYQRYRR